MNQESTFNSSIIQRTYTPNQWRQKENWYTDRVNNIHITESPSPQNIQSTAFQIDALLSMARIEYAYITQALDRFSTQLKIEEKRLFVDLKLSPPAQYAGLKLTVDEMKGVVASVLNNQVWENTGLSLYSLVQEASSRSIFMEAIIKTLQDKKELLIIHSSMLKIENSLDKMTSSVPN